MSGSERGGDGFDQGLGIEERRGGLLELLLEVVGGGVGLGGVDLLAGEGFDEGEFCLWVDVPRMAPNGLITQFKADAGGQALSRGGLVRGFVQKAVSFTILGSME
jgi:hypothetical protein